MGSATALNAAWARRVGVISYLSHSARVGAARDISEIAYPGWAWLPGEVRDRFPAFITAFHCMSALFTAFPRPSAASRYYFNPGDSGFKVGAACL